MRRMDWELARLTAYGAQGRAAHRGGAGTERRRRATATRATRSTTTATRGSTAPAPVRGAPSATDVTLVDLARRGVPGRRRRARRQVDGAPAAARRAPLHADRPRRSRRSGSCRRSSRRLRRVVDDASTTATEALARRTGSCLARARLPARADDRGRRMAAPLDGRGRVHQPAHHRSDLRRATVRSSTPANGSNRPRARSGSCVLVVGARDLRRVREHGMDHAAREPRCAAVAAFVVAGKATRLLHRGDDGVVVPVGLAPRRLGRGRLGLLHVGARDGPRVVVDRGARGTCWCVAARSEEIDGRRRFAFGVAARSRRRSCGPTSR